MILSGHHEQSLVSHVVMLLLPRPCDVKSAKINYPTGNSVTKGPILDRAPVAQLVEHWVVTREVVSSIPAGPTLRVLKITE